MGRHFTTAIVCMMLMGSSAVATGQTKQDAADADSVMRRTLIVTTMEGHDIEFVLDHGTRIQTLGMFIEVTSDGQAYYFKNSEVKQLNYGSRKVPTGVKSTEGLAEGELPFTLTDDALYFRSLKKGSTISIYSLDGQLLHSHYAEHSGEFTLKFSGLKTSVYIVRIDNMSYKIQR